MTLDLVFRFHTHSFTGNYAVYITALMITVTGVATLLFIECVEDAARGRLYKKWICVHPELFVYRVKPSKLKRNEPD